MQIVSIYFVICIANGDPIIILHIRKFREICFCPVVKNYVQV